MPRNYTRKHQRELEDLYDILSYYRCDRVVGIVGRNITILSEKRRLELLDWLWKQIHHKDVDYYGGELAMALHRLTPEQEIDKLEKQDMEDILYRYETIQYFHSKKDAKTILMEERGFTNEDALDRALSRARAKKRGRKRQEEEYKKRQKEELPTKKKMSDDDLPF
jgi:hypothetical protein